MNVSNQHILVEHSSCKFVRVVNNSEILYIDLALNLILDIEKPFSVTKQFYIDKAAD